MPFAVCMLKERKGALITTKCGRTKGVVVQDTHRLVERSDMSKVQGTDERP